MRFRHAVVEVMDDLSVSGMAQRMLRLLALVAAALAWLAGDLAGAGDSPLAFTLLLVSAAWCAIAPDSHAGLAVPLALGWQWLGHLDRTTSGWLLLASCCLLVFHSATSLAASAPAAAALDRHVLRPALVRTLALAGVTGLVWAAVRVSPLAGRAGRVELVVAGLVLLTAFAVVAAASLRAGERPS